MKRFIAALAVTVASTGAFGQNGKPFEQLDIDRALPNIAERVESATAYPDARSAPYEQVVVDRALPEILAGERTRYAAATGDTRSDVEIAVDAEAAGEEQPSVSPFANDPHFIAPPQ